MSDPGTSGSLRPSLLPLGDRALLVRYSDTLTDAANQTAIRAARQLEDQRLQGVEEVVPGLVSVMLRLGPEADFARLRGEIGLALNAMDGANETPRVHRVGVVFDGEDLGQVASMLDTTPEAFVHRHNARRLRVLATGFAPGFVYCGFHGDNMIVPRRSEVRPMVPEGTVLFAAGQTAIAATPIRTGWHVIGRTMFRNFDPATNPPVTLMPGDAIAFEAWP